MSLGYINIPLEVQTRRYKNVPMFKGTFVYPTRAQLDRQSICIFFRYIPVP